MLSAGGGRRLLVAHHRHASNFYLGNYRHSADKNVRIDRLLKMLQNLKSMMSLVCSPCHKVLHRT
jgi:hypothetical protein